MNFEAMSNSQRNQWRSTSTPAPFPVSEYRSLSDKLSFVLIALIIFCLPFLPQIALTPGISCSPIDILGIVCYACLLLRLEKVRFRIQEIFLLVYLLLVFTSLFYTRGLETSFQSFLRFIRLTAICGPFFLAASLRLRLSDLNFLFRLFVYGGGLGVFAGFLIWYFQLTVFSDTIQQAVYDDIVLNRAGGVFGESCAFGYLFGTWSSCCFLLLFEKFRSRKNILYTSLSAMLFFGLFLAVFYAVLSRGAAVLIIVSLSAYLVLPRLDRKKRSMPLNVFAIMILIVVGQFIVIIMFRPELWQKLQTVFYSNFIDRMLLATKYADFNTASSGRIENWENLLPLFWNNPFTGIGYKQLVLFYGIPSDSGYLGALVETGIFGLLAYLGFWTSCLLKLMRGVQSQPYAFILFCITLGTMVGAITTEVMTHWGSMPVFLALLGCVLATIRYNPRH
ncbi:MAG: O-antigen ligase family protein [Planctomycetes bacterium]|nr:O-antigen ligase family protein [Planctomycetota bacterium]